MGTAIDRNTTVNSTRHSPTTKTPKGSRAAPRRSETSSLMAVSPVTAVSTPYSSCHSALWSRNSRTRSLVASSVGPVVGSTWTMAVSAFWFGTATATVSTPGSFSMSALSPLTIFIGSVEVTMSAVTMTGPLNPGPNSFSRAS